MYNLNSKFNTFYKNYVVLSQTETQKLRERKDLNLDRLKSGLKEYNEENKTNYKVVDEAVQGSVAMYTVTQNDQNDYDIDVAIVFDKDNIPEGTTATKNIVVNALKKKCTQFNTEPEAKTNCVRVTYAEGYHIDFAVYRRFKNSSDEYEYEHAGSEWRARDPRAITKWFMERNKSKDYKLRKIVRLLKMFCKSRSHWDMPGGLIQTVLAEECYKRYERLDESFYYTIKAIRDRLKYNTEVKNPVESSLSLLHKESDKTKVKNLHNRLSIYIDKLKVLFDDKCTEKQAIEAWNELFNHSYWSDLVTENTNLAKSARFALSLSSFDYDETEEFIEDMFPVNLLYNLHIDCNVTQDGWRPQLLRRILANHTPLKINKKLEFYITTNNVPFPYRVYWKVKNVGEVAEQKNCIRGQIDMDYGNNVKRESSNFKGPHYVECYIIKNGVCVARDRINVPISSDDESIADFDKISC
jgi:hypothetical protein